MMKLSTFEDLLDLHGGDVARWPRDVQADARALLERSVAARASRDAMADVETVLRGSSRLADVGACDAVAARATRHRQETPARRLALRAGWAAVATLVLCVGLAVGARAPIEHEINPAHLMASALDASGSVADVE